MTKKLALKIFLNKSNNQINLSVPRKQLNLKDKDCFLKFKKAFVKLEGFE